MRVARYFIEYRCEKIISLLGFARPGKTTPPLQELQYHCHIPPYYGGYILLARYIDCKGRKGLVLGMDNCVFGCKVGSAREAGQRIQDMYIHVL